MSYPHDKAGWKGSVETGRQGSAKVSPVLKGRHAEVLADLEFNGPSTAEEIAARTGRHWFHVRPRISELKKLGLIVDTGERVDTGMGGKTHKVRLATAEEQALQKASKAAEQEKAA